MLALIVSGLSQTAWSVCTGYPAYIVYGTVIDTNITFTNLGSITYDGTGGTGVGLTICPGATYVNVDGADFDNSGNPTKIHATGTLSNSGVAAFSGNTGSNYLSNSGTIDNYATGSIINRDGATYSNANLTNNSGTVTTDASTRVSNFGIFNNNTGGLLHVEGQSDNYGVINNSGTLRSYVPGTIIFFTVAFKTGYFSNGSIINNQAGGLLSNEAYLLNAGTINNFGTLASLATSSFPHSYLENTTGTVTNHATGIIQVGGLDQLGHVTRGSFFSSGTLTNQGQITVSSGSSLWNNRYTFIDPNTNLPGPTYTGTLVNSGNLINDGEVGNMGNLTVAATGSVTGEGKYTQTTGITSVDGAIQQAAIAINGGWLKGVGVINGPVAVNGGIVSPGNASPGVLTINGSLGLQSGGVGIVAGGTTRGTGYGAVDANSITLGGNLSFSLVDIGGGMFAPQLGDKFDVLEANVISGDFSSWSLAPLNPGLGWSHGIVVLGNGKQVYELSVIAAPAAPVSVSGFWPASANSGASVFVFGSNFEKGKTQVAINGVPAPIMQVLDASLLIFIVPPGNPVGTITVTTGSGTANSTTNFGQPISGLAITGFWPASAKPGSIVFTFGTGFALGALATKITVNGVSAPVAQTLDTSILLFMVPSGAGSGPIGVTTAAGSVTSATSFTVLP